LVLVLINNVEEVMPDKKKPLSKDELLKKKMLSGWENEGGQPAPVSDVKSVKKDSKQGKDKK
jgi:hypothetical protein